MNHFYLPFPPSVNALFSNHKNRGRVKTQRYKDWIVEASLDLKKQSVDTFKGPVVVSYYVHRPDKRKRDLSNILKALDDFLVIMGLIEDDSLICAYDQLRWAGTGDLVWVHIRSANKDERKDACL